LPPTKSTVTVLTSGFIFHPLFYGQSWGSGARRRFAVGADWVVANSTGANRLHWRCLIHDGEQKWEIPRPADENAVLRDDTSLALDTSTEQTVPVSITQAICVGRVALGPWNEWVPISLVDSSRVRTG
jgi:hypothetical protein